MKKWLLLAALCATNASVFAQWTVPVPSSTVDIALDKENANYLYNLEAGGFFAGANEWGTRASIAGNGDKVYFESSDGEFFYLRCYPASKKEWKYVSANTEGFNLWVDAALNKPDTYQGQESWLYQLNDGYYTLTNDNAATAYKGQNLAVVELVEGKKNNTRLFFYTPEVTNKDGVLMFDGKIYDKWVFISDAEYEVLQPKVEIYMASVNFKAAIDAAKENDPKHDWSLYDEMYQNTSTTIEDMSTATTHMNAFVALNNEIQAKTPEYQGRCSFQPVIDVYNNPQSTVEELEAAKKQISDIISEYEQNQATFDNPANLAIGDGSSFDPWTREFTGEGTVGDVATNNWSTEANDGADGTDMTTPFCQVWKNSGNILSDQKVFQKLNAAPGLYELVIDLRAYNESGAIDQFKGISMFFGKDTIDLQSQVEMYVKNGKSVLWKEDYFRIISVVKEAGEIEFGINVKGANFNWFAFKNTSLKYYGNENANENAIGLMKDYMPEFEESDAAVYEPLKEAYNGKIAAFNKTKDFDEYMKLYNEISAAKAVIAENEAAYNELIAKIESWNSTREEKKDLGGDLWNDFGDFMDGESVEGYPEINIPSIVDGERPLNTAEVISTIAELTEKFSTALASAITPGTDCTDMLTNPSFAEGFKGWTGNTNEGAVYTSTDGAMNNVEYYQKKVDCYQVINKVPNGIYSLTCQAYERRPMIEGVDVPNVYFFMNQFKTAVQNISVDALPEDQGIDHENCQITGKNGDKETYVGEWPSDNKITKDGVDCLVPNSMQGASYAFKAGRYEQKVYGIVDNGQLKIGFTSNGKSIPDWLIWANLRLTFEGKTQEAVQSILASYMDELENLKSDSFDKLQKDEYEHAEKVWDDADKAYNEGDPDVMIEHISAIIKEIEAINARLDLIPIATTAYNSIKEAVDNYSSEYGDFEANASEEDVKIWKNWITTYDAGFREMTPEDIKAFAARGYKVMRMINSRLSSGEQRTKELLNEAGVSFEGASIDDPRNITAAIVNNNFEIVGEPTTDGWTFVKGGDTDSKPVSNDTYKVVFPEGYEDAGAYVFNTWSGSIPAGGLPIQQGVYGLPKGTYKLEAILASDAGNVVTLYANENSVDYTMEGDKTHATLAELTFFLDEDDYGVVIKVNSSSWYKCDYFRLTYYGKENVTAIDEVAAEPTAKDAEATAIYNLSGSRVSTLNKGINIVKMADGQVKKVFVK